VKLAYARTVTPRNLRLILCFSASLNGGFKFNIEQEGQKIKDQRDINYLSSFRHASSRNPFFILFLDTGIRRYDGRKVKVFVLPYQSHQSGFDLCFYCIPFCVIEHWKLKAEKREDCLSAASSAAPAVS
jgi:hypothetical protein